MNMRVIPHAKVSALCIAALGALSVSVSAYAGIGALSRANCIVDLVNESVTYDRPEFRSFIGGATSTHTRLGELEPAHPHLIDQNADTAQARWRYYAGDVGDSGTTHVHGEHVWMYVNDAGGLTGEYGERSTDAGDCNLSEW